MKEWQKIVQVYEKNNVFSSECIFQLLECLKLDKTPIKAVSLFQFVVFCFHQKSVSDMGNLRIRHNIFVFKKSKMADDKEWVKIVSDVYDLILHETDKIVDDTSLEKFLDIINDDLKQRDLLLQPLTIHFLDKMPCCLNANAIAFGLRLTGDICAINETYFQALVENNIFSKNSLFHGLFDDKSYLWEEPCVRDSFFKCATNILERNEGLQLMKELDCVKKAVNCLVDSSIFVEESARKFIAKYMISIYHLSDTTHEHWKPDEDSGLTSTQLTCISCLSFYLRSLLQVSPYGITRTITIQVSITQLVLTLVETNAIVGQNILREQPHLLPSCFQLLYSGNKNESRKVIDVILTFLNNTSNWNINWNLLLNEENCLEYLLKVVLNLYQRSLISFALQMTRSLFNINCPSDAQEQWFSTLFATITSPLHYSSHAENKSSCDVNKTDNAIQQLLSMETTNEVLYKILDEIFVKNIKEGSMLSSTIISYSTMLTCDVVQSLIENKMCESPRVYDLISNWFKDILSLFHTTVNNQSKYENHLLRQCIKAVILLVQNRCFEKDETLLLDSVKLSCLLFKILQNNSDTQLLTESLKCFQILFTKTDLLLQHRDKKTEDPFSLTEVFQCCFNHHSWDLRDSILALIKSNLSTLSREKLRIFSEFLVTNRFLTQIWKMKEDIESFVRTSMIELLAKLPHHEYLWINFLRDLQLSQEEIILEVFQLFVQDESAFVRRSIFELLKEWLNLGILAIFLEHNESRQLEPRLCNILYKASEDFDWEVKICVLNFWEEIYMKYQDKVKGNESLKDVLLTIIKNGLVDCDKPVQKRSVELMNTFQDGGFFTEIKLSFDELDLIKESTTLDNAKEEALYFLKDVILSATNNQDNLLDCY